MKIINQKIKGKHIIKQPNGKYFLFSSVAATITHHDMSEKEIIDLWTEEAREKIAKRVKGTIETLQKERKPFGYFHHTYNETLSLIEEIHGKEVADIAKREIEGKDC